jgi:hypothetical protein
MFAMLPVLMIVGGLLALWVQSQPLATEQNLPNGILRAIGGMLVVGGTIAFFSQPLAWILVGVGLAVGFLTMRNNKD